jgi:hypothetical protein
MGQNPPDAYIRIDQHHQIDENNAYIRNGSPSFPILVVLAVAIRLLVGRGSPKS